MYGISLGFQGLWDGMDSELEPSTVGHLGHVWDVPGLPGTLGWDGQWAVCSGMLGTCPAYILGQWDGMDSGVGALCSGTLKTCFGISKRS